MSYIIGVERYQFWAVNWKSNLRAPLKLQVLIIISFFLTLFPKPKDSGFACIEMQEDNVHKIHGLHLSYTSVILKSEPNDALTITQITCMTFFMQRVCIVLLKTYIKSVRKVAIGIKRKIKKIKQPMKLTVVEKYTNEGRWCNHYLPPLSL